MANQEQQSIAKICNIYKEISKLENLKPSQNVNSLFKQLVVICTDQSPIDVSKLNDKVQEIRSKLIKCCGQAEGLPEGHFSSIIGSHENAPDQVTIFPYYSNYQKLSQVEFAKLTEHCKRVPKRIAFVGSGPLPLTSIFLATNHFKTTSFHNYDIDHSANTKANRPVSSHSDLSKQMLFHTKNIMDVPRSELKEYEVVFLAALVGGGVDKADKVKVINHLAKNMAPGAFLLLKSAHGVEHSYTLLLIPILIWKALRFFQFFILLMKSSILSLLHISFDAPCPLLESLIMEATTLTQSIRK